LQIGKPKARQLILSIRGERVILATNLAELCRFLFASRPSIIGQVLGIVYRCIATHLIKKAGFSLLIRPIDATRAL
jgi:hypothetical protein